jgi:hypothetical protein
MTLAPMPGALEAWRRRYIAGKLDVAPHSAAA